MKGIEPIIAAVLLIAISVAGIAIVLENGRTSVSRLNELSLYNEAKDSLGQIESAINAVASEGQGSTRVLRLSISDGEYSVDAESDTISFYMDSPSQLVGDGVVKTEDGIEIIGMKRSLAMKISYTGLDITGDYRFGAGHRNVVIKNNGYNETAEKQTIAVSD
jgi:hypothetical protein